MRRLPQLNWSLRRSAARDASVAMRDLPIDLPDGMEVRKRAFGRVLPFFVCRSLCGLPFVKRASVHGTPPGGLSGCIRGGTWGRVYRF